MRGILWPPSLKLLGHTRHYGYRVEVINADAFSSRKVLLDRGAHHLLRRLAARQVRNHLGVTPLRVVHPTWATRGAQRHRRIALQPAKQLCCLYHDGQVSRQDKVKDLVKADATHHPCDEGRGFAVAESVLLSNMRPHGWSDKAHHDLAWIIDGFEDAAAFALIVERSGGTGPHALAPADAIGHVEWLVVRAAHPEQAFAELEGEHAWSHEFGAGGNA